MQDGCWLLYTKGNRKGRGEVKGTEERKEWKNGRNGKEREEGMLHAPTSINSRVGRQYGITQHCHFSLSLSAHCIAGFHKPCLSVTSFHPIHLWIACPSLPFHPFQHVQSHGSPRGCARCPISGFCFQTESAAPTPSDQRTPGVQIIQRRPKEPMKIRYG